MSQYFKKARASGAGPILINENNPNNFNGVTPSKRESKSLPRGASDFSHGKARDGIWNNGGESND